MCCNSPRARARREARRAAKIAFAKKVFNVVTGKRHESSYPVVQEKPNSGYETMEYGAVGNDARQQRPPMYTRSLAETQLPSYNEVVEGSTDFKDEKK